MKKIVLIASLLLLAVGCGPAPKKVAVVDEIPVVTVPAPEPVENTVVVTPEVDNDLVLPEPIIPEPEPIVSPEPVVEAEKDCQCVDCGCKQGKPCNCCGAVCKCPNCECEEAIQAPPKKETPPVYTEPPVKAGYVRRYWTENGQRWYRDYPVSQQSGANCANGDCSGSSRRAILPWRR